MLALGIRYLNGFVVASEPDARERPEWPPHPARVFMALAAAHFQTGGDAGERKALEWLQSLPPPALRVPAGWPRLPVTHYVPVNDKPGEMTKPPKAIIQSAPQLARDRQPRRFARAWLEDETAYVMWRDVVAEEPVACALESLCAKVSRIGHSSSLVQMWVARSDEVGEPTWVPDDEQAELQLRVAGPGTLEELERRYNAEAVDAYASLLALAEDDSDRKAKRKAKEQLKRLEKEFGGAPQQLRPQVSLYHGYARPKHAKEEASAGGSVFDHRLIVFVLERRSGPFSALGLQAVLTVAQRWREALVNQANDMPERVRAIISGHDQDG
ncbi:MAG: type I-U CRISPR-associated protein Cas5/Cas6 [Chloroflexi bacterium]|nr:type I-U CRISPR-associated protein Cas5/Cas6 [Chloroflexota bacterium]